MIDRVQLESGGIRVSVNLKRLIADSIETRDAASLTMTRFIPMEMKRRGVELSLVIEGETSAAKRPDPSLLKAIARGHRWFHELASGRTAAGYRVRAARSWADVELALEHVRHVRQHAIVIGVYHYHRVRCERERSSVGSRRCARVRLHRGVPV